MTSSNEVPDHEKISKRQAEWRLAMQEQGRKLDKLLGRETSDSSPKKAEKESAQ